jgi:hypothetical protein
MGWLNNAFFRHFVDGISNFEGGKVSKNEMLAKPHLSPLIDCQPI